MGTLLDDVATDIGGFYDTSLGFAESVARPFPLGSILAVVDLEYTLTDTGGFAGVAGTVPVMRTLDADACAVGDDVQIRGIVYSVVEVMPDGAGETLHRLQQ